MKSITFYCAECDILIDLNGFFADHSIICPNCHNEMTSSTSYDDNGDDKPQYTM